MKEIYMEEKKSEFGKGFVYCLGLFLCHADRHFEDKSRGFPAHIWLYGAADHIYEFEAEKAPEPFRERCIYFRDKIFSRRMESDVTWEEVESLIQECKDILRTYDEFNGFEPIKGDCE